MANVAFIGMWKGHVVDCLKEIVSQHLYAEAEVRHDIPSAAGARTCCLQGVRRICFSRRVNESRVVNGVRTQCCVVSISVTCAPVALQRWATFFLRSFVN